MALSLRGMVALGLTALALAARAGAGEDPFTALGVERIANPRPAPSIVFPDLNGRLVNVTEEFRGKVVLLGFFTTT